MMSRREAHPCLTGGMKKLAEKLQHCYYRPFLLDVYRISHPFWSYEPNHSNLLLAHKSQQPLDLEFLHAQLSAISF